MYGQSIAECKLKQPDNLNRPQKHKEPKNLSFITWKKIKFYQTKILKSINSSEKTTYR